MLRPFGTTLWATGREEGYKPWSAKGRCIPSTPPCSFLELEDGHLNVLSASCRRVLTQSSPKPSHCKALKPPKPQDSEIGKSTKHRHPAKQLPQGSLQDAPCLYPYTSSLKPDTLNP